MKKSPEQNGWLVKLVILLIVGGLVVTSFAAEKKPGCYDPAFRQFDFWLGDWQVYDAKGKLAGSNRVEKLLDGCALQENWMGARGIGGTSLNFYDAARQKWHQTWISAFGPLYLEGGLVEGEMVLRGERPDQSGQKVLHEIRWTPLKDGRVKQHWRSSADNGKTWKDVFVGFYQRKTS